MQFEEELSGVDVDRVFVLAAAIVTRGVDEKEALCRAAFLVSQARARGVSREIVDEAGGVVAVQSIKIDNHGKLTFAIGER